MQIYMHYCARFFLISPDYRKPMMHAYEFVTLFSQQFSEAGSNRQKRKVMLR